MRIGGPIEEAPGGALKKKEKVSNTSKADSQVG